MSIWSRKKALDSRLLGAHSQKMPAGIVICAAQRRACSAQACRAAGLNRCFEQSPVDALIGIKFGSWLRRQIPVWRGPMSCLMNPKAYVFMVAVFPQFVRPDYGPLGVQAVLMGLIIASTQILIYGSFAWGAGGIQQWLRRNPAAQVAIGRGVGVLLMLAALWTGWHGIRLGH